MFSHHLMKCMHSCGCYYLLTLRSSCSTCRPTVQTDSCCMESSNAAPTALSFTIRSPQHATTTEDTFLRCSAETHTHINTQTLIDAHSLYENERVRLAAKAGLARGLMMPACVCSQQRRGNTCQLLLRCKCLY